MRSHRRHETPTRARRGSRLAGLLLLLGAGGAEASVAPDREEPLRLRPPAPLMRRSWTIDDGLPQNGVFAIAQTPDGYLWIGTQEGLARFDGVQFRLFDRRPSPGPPSPAILALHVSRDGRLWIGTDRGLLRLEAGFLVPVSLASDRVHVIRESRDGGLWAGTSGGLARLGPDGSGPGAGRLLAGQEVVALHEDGEGRLWAGGSGGLHVCGSGGCAEVGLESGLPPGPVSALWGAGDGGLWVGTPCCGLYRLAGRRAEARGPPGEHVVSVLEDRQGTVWLATEQGLRSFREGRFQTFPGDPHGLSRRAYSVFEDREGSLWVGLYYDGLARLSVGKVAAYGRAPDLSYPPVSTVYEDRKGSVWFGTFGHGLGRLSEDGVTFRTREQGLPEDIAGPIVEDAAGVLWVGVRSSGTLYRLTAAGLSPLRLGSHPPRILHEDPPGTLWIGTRGGGLYRWRGGRLDQWTTREGLPSDTVRTIASDGEGGLWLGTLRGLVRFREEGLTVYDSADGRPLQSVAALYRDPDGPLWIGTGERGLGRYADGRFAFFGSAQGLCDDRVFVVLDDGLGSLWMSSNRGIFQVSKKDLDEVAAGTRPRVSCTLYGRGDGMESSECNGGIQPAGFRGRDGRLWFATVQGLAVVDPSALGTRNLLPPPVWIEEVQVDGRTVPLADGAHVPPGTRRLEVAYTGLSLVAPEKVRFRHRLLGFDSDWVEAGGRRSASYTSLPPGDYVFQVIASNNDGLWNEEGARLSFRVRPFFYQTTWFYLAIALLLAGAAGAVHTVRVRGLRLRNALLAERARVSQEIHDSMSQIMTGVILQLDAATETLPQGPGACRPYLARASRLAKEGIDEARRILRGLPDPAIERSDFSHGLRGRVASIIEGTEVSLQVREEGRPFPLTRELKGELLHIAQEAVTNALRHGQARRIVAVIAFEDRGIRLTVEDDGRGFAPAVPGAGGSGLGLAGMARRVSDRQGTLDIHGRPGGGTTLAAYLPRH